MPLAFVLSKESKTTNSGCSPAYSLANSKTHGPIPDKHIFAAWEHLPTKAVRVPEIFLEEIEKYARSLDGQCSPFEAIISALDKLNPDELAQIKLAIESLSGGELKSVSSLQDSLVRHGGNKPPI